MGDDDVDGMNGNGDGCAVGVKDSGMVGVIRDAISSVGRQACLGVETMFANE